MGGGAVSDVHYCSPWKEGPRAELWKGKKTGWGNGNWCWTWLPLGNGSAVCWPLAQEHSVTRLRHRESGSSLVDSNLEKLNLENLNFHLYQRDKTMRIGGQNLTCPKSALLICQSWPTLAFTCLAPGHGVSPLQQSKTPQHKLTEQALQACYCYWAWFKLVLYNLNVIPMLGYHNHSCRCFLDVVVVQSKYIIMPGIVSTSFYGHCVWCWS